MQFFAAFTPSRGGAGFLNLENLVIVCHRAEDIFNLLRQGELHIDSELMDAILPVLDVVNAQFDELRGGQEPSPAPADLISTLEVYASGGKPSAAPAAEEAPVEGPAAAEPEAEGDITDAEFEALLDAMPQTSDAAPSAEPAPTAEESEAGGDDITDEEFEALLDNLHGKGQFGGVPEAEPSTPAPSAPQAEEPAAEAGAGGDLITDEEFDKLLDELHGAGKGPTAGAQPAEPEAPKAAEPEQPAPAPAPKPAPKKAAKKPAAPKAEPAKPAAAKAPPAETTVRVDTKRLDDIMNLVGELVLVRNRMQTLRSTVQDEQLGKAVGNLDLVTADLQSAVMKTRMQPIKKVFGRFPRVVRDLSRSLNKKISLELVGEETDLDKNLVEALADPLIHLVRNAVDHGIETPEDRKAKGKPEEGQVVLSAAQEGDHILLMIEDDGKGMDPNVLRKKAVEKGMMDEEAANRLTDHDAYNLIFMPGFSTKTEISDVSGRGVGMDVVKTSITALNGSVEIDSELGKGSVIRIKVPLTLAIMPTLMIIVGDQRFAIPLTSVGEIFDLDLSNTNVVDDQEVVIIREKAVPLFYLRRWLVRNYVEDQSSIQGHVVVVYIGNQRVGIVVDQLVGQEEVVIKPLGSGLHGLPGFAGATITGDGGIALILDIPSLIKANT